MLVEQIRFSGPGEVEVSRVEENPDLGTEEVLLAPSRVGICGSDLHLLHGRHPFVRPPVVTGHEVGGAVVEVGPGVTDLIPGQRVLVNPLFYCGQCARCRQGRVNRCEMAKVLGFGLPGAARTRAVLPASQLHPVPATLTDDAICLAEPLSAGYHAVRRAATELADVLVLGGGPIGLSTVLAAKALGAGRVTLVEPVEAKRALARDLGADSAVAPDELVERRHTGAFDCVGTPKTLRSAVEHCVGGATVVLVGVPGGAAPALPLARMQRFEIDLLGSGLYTPGEVDSVLGLIDDGTLDPTPLVSASYDMSEAATAYSVAAEANQVKVLIRING